MRSRVVLGLLAGGMLFSSCAGDFSLSKEEAAAVGGLIGAGVAAATHKHYKAKAKDAAIRKEGARLRELAHGRFAASTEA